jgi:ABC-type Fe3+ transport system substrate-binding protein
VFVNWLLSKEGQATYTKETATNSRRVDVPPAVPEKQVQPDAKPVLQVGPLETDALTNETVAMMDKLIQ